MACMEAGLLFHTRGPGIAGLQCSLGRAGKARQSRRGRGALFFNQQGSYTYQRRKSWVLGVFFSGFTSTTTGWDGDGDEDGVGVGWRPAAKERRVELETCASPLVFVARTLLSIMDERKRGRVLMLCRYLALIVTNSLYGYPGVPVPLDIHLAYCIGRFT